MGTQFILIAIVAIACGITEAIVINEQNKLIDAFEKQVKETIDLYGQIMLDYSKELQKNMNVSLIIAKADMEKENYGITMKKIKEELMD